MSKIKIKPAEQRIVVLPLNREETRTKAGIILPGEIKKDKPETGLIVSTGKGSADHPMEYFVGEKVIYSNYAGIEVDLDLGEGSETYKVMNQMDIMAVIEDLK